MNTRIKKSIQRGFTLIELLTVLVIMSLITLSLLVQQGKFDSSTVLRSLAYSVALSVRQAQIYGVSVVGSTISSGVSYAPAYGVYFNNKSQKSYLIFGDTYPLGPPVGNGVYDIDKDVIAQSFSLNNGYTISKFCVQIANSTPSCSDAANGPVSLEIVFKRPNPDANFVALDANGNPLGSGYSSASISVTGPNGDTRIISVSLTGEVSVGAPITL